MEEDFIPKSPAHSPANLTDEDFTPRKSADSRLPFIIRPADDAKFTVFSSPQDGFQAYVYEEVLKIISGEMADAAPNETIGLLAGRVLRDSRGPYTLVLAAQGARGHEIEATPSHVGISASGHAQVRSRLEATAYGYDIVGWYHSHPRYPARFSPVDVTEQSTFRDKNHVGIVVSGIDEREPFGVYRGPKAFLLVAPKRVPLPRLLTQTVNRRAGPLPAEAHVATEVLRHTDAPTHASAQTLTAPPPAGKAERLNRALPWALTVVMLGVIACLIGLAARVRKVEGLCEQTKVAGQGGVAAQEATAPPAQGDAGTEVTPGGAGRDALSSSPSAGLRPPLAEGSTPRANPLIPSITPSREQRKQRRPRPRTGESKSTRRKPGGGPDASPRRVNSPSPNKRPA